ncbi:hypothetical protein FA10DRAFT_296045 [Acaromyces ingoldii]|uniref:Uncharacterized protein n=1 Tax=Acaromyces ingoldii TaxID=215250 RepID=A0A316YKE2_9BASI|nr:hypothetical protein FA10DRAFT_296045 [Acaromyces ingoldii]PWN88523.1 hypothetical protein FA10DRAFT_296045 [Acaromyces ingoldii]
MPPPTRIRLPVVDNQQRSMAPKAARPNNQPKDDTSLQKHGKSTRHELTSQGAQSIPSYSPGQFDDASPNQQSPSPKPPHRATQFANKPPAQFHKMSSTKREESLVGLGLFGRTSSHVSRPSKVTRHHRTSSCFPSSIHDQISKHKHISTRTSTVSSEQPSSTEPAAFTGTPYSAAASGGGGAPTAQSSGGSTQSEAPVQHRHDAAAMATAIAAATGSFIVLAAIAAILILLRKRRATAAARQRRTHAVVSRFSSDSGGNADAGYIEKAIGGHGQHRQKTAPPTPTEQDTKAISPWLENDGGVHDQPLATLPAAAGMQSDNSTAQKGIGKLSALLKHSRHHDEVQERNKRYTKTSSFLGGAPAASAAQSMVQEHYVKKRSTMMAIPSRIHVPVSPQPVVVALLQEADRKQQQEQQRRKSASSTPQLPPLASVSDSDSSPSTSSPWRFGVVLKGFKGQTAKAAQGPPRRITVLCSSEINSIVFPLPPAPAPTPTQSSSSLLAFKAPQTAADVFSEGTGGGPKKQAGNGTTPPALNLPFSSLIVAASSPISPSPSPLGAAAGARPQSKSLELARNRTKSARSSSMKRGAARNRTRSASCTAGAAASGDLSACREDSKESILARLDSGGPSAQQADGDAGLAWRWLAEALSESDADDDEDDQELRNGYMAGSEMDHHGQSCDDDDATDDDDAATITGHPSPTTATAPAADNGLAGELSTKGVATVFTSINGAEELFSKSVTPTRARVAGTEDSTLSAMTPPVITLTKGDGSAEKRLSLTTTNGTRSRSNSESSSGEEDQETVASSTYSPAHTSSNGSGSSSTATLIDVDEHEQASTSVQTIIIHDREYEQGSENSNESADRSAENRPDTQDEQDVIVFSPLSTSNLHQEEQTGDSAVLTAESEETEEEGEDDGYETAHNRMMSTSTVSSLGLPWAQVALPKYRSGGLEDMDDDTFQYRPSSTSSSSVDASM